VRPRIVRWNLTPKRKKWKRADVLVISPGKSGRTWLRVLIHRALALHFDVPFDVERMGRDRDDVPFLVFTHELASHVRDDPPGCRLLGRSLVPNSIAARKKVLLLARDPRDVIVSSFFHKTKRSKRIDCTLSEFIRHPRYGIEGIVWVLNQWRARFREHPDCLWLSYEAMQADPAAELARVLAFLEVDASPETIAEAVAFASFDNMKQGEASGTFQSDRLQPGDASDPDSYKVRKGKVRGYLEHFEGADLECVDRAVARLDPFYGYE